MGKLRYELTLEKKETCKCFFWRKRAKVMSGNVRQMSGKCPAKVPRI